MRGRWATGRPSAARLDGRLRRGGRPRRGDRAVPQAGRARRRTAVGAGAASGSLVVLKELVGRREPAAHRVLRRHARLEELQQVVRPARLRADAAHLEAAERLALDERSGDAAVDVEIADAVIAQEPLEGSRAAADEAAGEGVLDAVGDGQRLVYVGGLQDGDHETEDLLLRDDRVRPHVDADVGRDEIAAAGPAALGRLDDGGQRRLALALLDVALDLDHRVGGDDRADAMVCLLYTSDAA